MLPRFTGRERSDVPVASGNIQTEGEPIWLWTTFLCTMDMGYGKMVPKEATLAYFLHKNRNVSRHQKVSRSELCELNQCVTFAIHQLLP